MIDHSYLEGLISKPFQISTLKFESIFTILNSAKEVLKRDNLLLEFNLEQNDEAIVLGDIHGNLISLLKILEIINERKPKLTIFLGDLVDRGTYQLECLILVLALKLLNPDKIFLLRGNHETLEMNQSYGFYDYFIEHFQEQKRFDNFLDLYDTLPLCAIINKSILCLHGGIPNDNKILKKLKKLKVSKLNNLQRRILSTSMFQIMWNDPNENATGFTENFRGVGTKFFW